MPTLPFLVRSGNEPQDSSYCLVSQYWKDAVQAGSYYLKTIHQWRQEQDMLGFIKNCLLL
jgi:hypothetical protein